MMIRTTLLHIGVLTILSTIPSILFGQDGSVVLKQGYLKLTHADAEKIYREPDREISVYSGDEIHTGKDSSAIVKMREQSEEIQLYAKTFFKIEHVKEEQTLVDLWIGKAKFLVNPLVGKLFTRKRGFRVHTTSATIGVKGTEFLVGTSPQGTNILTLSGVVSFASRFEPEVEVEVRENQVSRITKTAPPSTPEVIPEELQKKIIENESPEAWSEEEFEQLEKESPLGEKQSEAPIEETKSTMEPVVAELAEEDSTEELTETIEEISETLELVEDIVDQTTSTETKSDIDIQIEF